MSVKSTEKKPTPSRASLVRTVKIDFDRQVYGEICRHAESAGMGPRRFIHILLDLGWKTLFATAEQLASGVAEEEKPLIEVAR